MEDDCIKTPPSPRLLPVPNAPALLDVSPLPDASGAGEDEGLEGVPRPRGGWGCAPKRVQPQQAWQV